MRLWCAWTWVLLTRTGYAGARGVLGEVGDERGAEECAMPMGGGAEPLGWGRACRLACGVGSGGVGDDGDWVLLGVNGGGVGEGCTLPVSRAEAEAEAGAGPGLGLSSVLAVVLALALDDEVGVASGAQRWRGRGGGGAVGGACVGAVGEAGFPSVLALVLLDVGRWRRWYGTYGSAFGAGGPAMLGWGGGVRVAADGVDRRGGVAREQQPSAREHAHTPETFKSAGPLRLPPPPSPLSSGARDSATPATTFASALAAWCVVAPSFSLVY